MLAKGPVLGRFFIVRHVPNGVSGPTHLVGSEKLVAALASYIGPMNYGDPADVTVTYSRCRVARLIYNQKVSNRKRRKDIST